MTTGLASGADDEDAVRCARVRRRRCAPRVDATADDVCVKAARMMMRASECHEWISFFSFIDNNIKLFIRDE